MSKRQRVPPTEEWQQFSLLIDFPEQRTSAALHPLVRFGYSPEERPRGAAVCRLVVLGGEGR